MKKKFTEQQILNALDEAECTIFMIMEIGIQKLLKGAPEKEKQHTKDLMKNSFEIFKGALLHELEIVEKGE